MHVVQPETVGIIPKFPSGIDPPAPMPMTVESDDS